MHTTIPVVTLPQGGLPRFPTKKKTKNLDPPCWAKLWRARAHSCSTPASLMEALAFSCPRSMPMALGGFPSERAPQPGLGFFKCKQSKQG